MHKIADLKKYLSISKRSERFITIIKFISTLALVAEPRVESTLLLLYYFKINQACCKATWVVVIFFL